MGRDPIENKYNFHIIDVLASYQGNVKDRKRIETFCEIVDIERWLSKFELAIQVYDLKTQEDQILSIQLMGPVYNIWNGLSTDDKKDASAIKKSLRKVFGLRSSFNLYVLLYNSNFND